MPLDMLVGKVDEGGDLISPWGDRQPFDRRSKQCCDGDDGLACQPANGQRSKPSAMPGGGTTSTGMLNGRHGRARKLAVGRWQAHWKGDLALYRGHRLERELQIAK